MGNLAASLHNVFSQIYSRTRGHNLKALCAQSSIALGLGAIAGQGARFIRNIILARILAREEFGLERKHIDFVRYITQSCFK